MKKFILIILIGFWSISFVKAQDDDGSKKAEKIEALKVAFITQKLELTPDEAQKFWPVYNNYEKDMGQIVNDKNNPDVIDNDEKLLNIRKKYRSEFIKVIGQPRMNKLFNAEREFRGVLLRRLKNNQNNQRLLLRRHN